MKLPKKLCLSIALIAMGTGLDRNAAQATIPSAPWSSYQQVWAQDFTTMTTLSQLNVRGGVGPMGTYTWVSHKPDGGDWFTFIDPVSNNNPFGVGSGYLDISAAVRGYGDPNNWFSGYSAGLLSSMDSAGAGFAQQYGYFETSMYIPTGLNEWPGFWLMDQSGLTGPAGDRSEIDILEEYGNAGYGTPTAASDPDLISASVHHWPDGTTSNLFWQTQTVGAGARSGYHTYGVDVEPTTTTFYYDRQQYYQVPTIPASQRPLFVMMQLALGGGNYNNATVTGYDWTLTPNPSHLKVQYVAVWASPNSPNYTGAPPTPTGLTASAGNTQAILTWNSGGATYNVYRGTSSGSETLLASGITTPYYNDTGLTNGTSYFYKVAAVNGSGTSSQSNETSAVPSSSANSGTGTSFITGQTLGTLRNDFTGNVGFAFTTGTSPVTVTSVGRWIVSGNSGVHTVKIVTTGDQSDVPGTAVTFSTSGKTAGQFAYVPLSSPVTLAANTSYYLVSGEKSGGDQWYNADTTVTTTSVASITSAEFYNAPYYTSGSANNTFVPVSFKYSSGGGSVPSAPTALTATSGNAQIALSWTASSGATSYNVYRGTTTGGESGTAIATGITGTTYTNTGLTNGTAYYYKVAAVNGTGTSGMSNEASATPSSGVTIPSAPTGLSATAGNAQIALAWTASSGATSYNVYRGTTAGGESATAIATGITATSYTNTGLTNGTAYYYKVKAVNSAGSSGYSGETNATPTAGGGSAEFVTGETLGTLRNNFGGFVGLQFTTGSSAVTVNGLGRWVVSGNTGSHTVKLVLASTQADVSGGSVTVNTSGKTAGQFAYANLASSITLPANTSYFLVSNEMSGGDQWYDSNTALTHTTVATVDAGVYYNSPYLNAGTTNNSFVPVSFQYTSGGGGGSAPSAPTGLSASSGNAQIGLSWTASSGATSYNVYRGTTAGGESGTAIATGITGTTYTNTGLTNGTSYYYKVAAVNASGTSGMSNEASATPSADTTFITGQTLGTIRNNWSGGVGFAFTVGSSPITVTSLGRWIVFGNSGSHTVKLVTSSGTDVTGGSVTINTSGQTAGQFAYANLASGVTLSASTSYYIVSVETSGGDQWYDSDTTLTHTTAASITNATWYNPPYNITGGTNHTFGPVSFKYH